MRVLSLVSLTALALCTGCTAPNGWQSTSAGNGACGGGSQQASLAPLPCAHRGWPPGSVYTHPNGDGPQVEIWGPPSAGFGGGGA